MPRNVTRNKTNCDWLFDMSVKSVQWMQPYTPDPRPSAVSLKVWLRETTPHLHSIVIKNALSMYKETLQWRTVTLWPHFEWTKGLYSFYFSHEPMEYSMLLMRSVHTAHHLSWSLTQHFIQCTQRNSRQPKWLSLTITKPIFCSGLWVYSHEKAREALFFLSLSIS